jgi:hypothetical protein
MAHIRTAFEAAHARTDLIILIGVEPESPEIDMIVCAACADEARRLGLRVVQV